MGIGRVLLPRMSKRPINFQALVSNRMRQRGLTAYRLQEMTGLRQQTILNFLNGTAIGCNHLATLLDALDFSIVPTEKLK